MIVGVSKCSQGPVVLLFCCGGVVFGVVYYVAGCVVHDVFVILVL